MSSHLLCHRLILSGLTICLTLFAGCSSDPNGNSTANDDEPSSNQESPQNNDDPIANDDVPLTVTIVSGPEEWTNSNEAHFELSCNPSERCEFQCSHNQAPLQPCEASTSVDNLDDGEHTFSAIAVDGDGLESEPAVWNWNIDTVPPEVVDLNGPESPTSEQDATFEFACSKQDCTFECSHAGGSFDACESGITYQDLFDGDHTLEVRAIDSLGNVGDAAIWEWTIDTVPPLVIYLDGPDDPISSTDAEFSFQCSKNDCTFDCALNEGDFSSCESGVTYEDLAEGEQVFRIQATDPQGTTGPEIEWEWTVDTVEPLINVLDAPPAQTEDDTATFEFECDNKPHCSFECSLGDDEGSDETEPQDWQPCSSPHSVQELEPGDYRMTLRATDEAGNQSTVTHQWTVLPVERFMVSIGTYFACAIHDEGSLWCWGSGNNGQLGLGDTDTRFAPAQVGTEESWRTVSTGLNHACATGDDGSLWCWGGGSSGQLGLGDTEDRLTPTQVGDATDWVSVSAGQNFTCGLRDDGSLWCWGRGTSGRTGHGDFDQRNAPEQVGDELHWQSVSTGVSHACAIQADDSLWCWGNGLYGKHGHGDTDTQHSPKKVDADSGFTSVSAGSDHSCAVGNDNSLWCWGRGRDGRLGIDDMSAHHAPEQVGDDTDWKSVSAGSAHSCALRSDDSLWCWGSGSSGQLGIGTTDNHLTPEPVSDATNWTSIATGSAQSCAITDDEELYCWGSNQSGKLGVGENPGDKSTPIELDTDAEILEFAAGDEHGCAISTDGSLWCWGRGFNGQLGIGEFSPSPSPIQVGDDFDWNTLTTRADHTCALRDDDSLWCWGSGDFGRLGLGDEEVQFAPQRVGDDFLWKAVSAGSSHTCAIRDDGTLWCWGHGANGRLGLGDTEGRLAPSQVGDHTRWKTVSAGSAHSCATREDGSLWCWGHGHHGRLGLGDSIDEHLEPQLVDDDAHWSAVSTGTRHTCALRQTGSLYCWGRGIDGRLGIGDISEYDTTIPQQVGDDDDWQTLSAGYFHTCGIRDDDSLWCWGAGGYGKLGNGDSSDRFTPEPVDSDADWVDVDAGNTQTHGIDHTHQGWSWGHNNNGQLGDGTRRKETPQKVWLP